MKTLIRFLVVVALTALSLTALQAPASAAPVQIRDASLTHTTFYPTVRDGYRDTTRLRFRLNRRAFLRVKVINSNGGTIRGEDIGWRNAGGRSWTWDGRRNDGQTVGTGRFRIRLIAKDADGNRDAVQKATNVATGHRWVRRSKAKAGYYWGARRKRGTCYISRDNYFRTATLDCWGGRYAWARYGFRIPGNARDVRWSVRGERGCCSNGRVTKGGWRPKSYRFVVRVKVTNWASYEIRRVRVSFLKKERI